MGQVICWDQQANQTALPLGGKALALAKLQRQGFTIPRWFAVVPQANDGQFVPLLTPEQQKALAAAVDALAPNGERLAVRSSAVQEDGQSHSFAGMYESYLNVSPEAVAQTIVSVWQSAHSARLQTYQEKTKPVEDWRWPTVIVQRMVFADAAGIAFSADPVSGERTLAVVSAVEGLGDRLAAGAVDGDTWLVSDSGSIVRRTLANPTEPPALSDGWVLAVADLARKAAQVAGDHQDVEWAVEGQTLYLLQSRPITTLPPSPNPPEGPRPHYVAWDRSGPMETWDGAVSPMTYHLAAVTLTAYYQNLARHTCVPKCPPSQTQSFLAPYLAGVCGAFAGRVAVNRTALDALWVAAPSVTYLWGKWFGPAADQYPLAQRWAGRGLTLLATVKMAMGYCSLSNNVRAFESEVDRLLADEGPLDNLPGNVLATMEAMLHWIGDHWEAPTLVNYYASLLLGWAQEETSLQQLDWRHDWLEGAVESVTAPWQQAQFGLRDVLKQHPDLWQCVTTQQAEAFEVLLAKQSQAKQAVDTYLTRYGGRSAWDHTLELSDLASDPAQLLSLLASLPEKPSIHSLGKNPLDGLPPKLTLLLKALRTKMAEKERLRWCVTRLMARLRRLKQALGRSLVRSGHLADTDQVVLLSVSEWQQWLSASPENEALQALLNQRAQAWQQWKAQPEPPVYFSAYGQLILDNLEPAVQAGDETTTLIGIGASSGVVQGVVFVSVQQLPENPHEPVILVIPSGDPGLVTVFPRLAGLVLERGSLLSHVAIVAREMGLPTVVAVSGACQWLKPGDRLELDGAKGTVTLTGVGLLSG